MPDTPLRMALTLAAIAAFLWGGILFLQWGFASRHWSPPIVATISLTVSNVGLWLYVLFAARNRRSHRKTHA